MTVTTYEAATALVLEARRRGQSYGQLVSSTDWQEQGEIIAAYMARKQSGGKKRRQTRRRSRKDADGERPRRCMEKIVKESNNVCKNYSIRS